MDAIPEVDLTAHFTWATSNWTPAGEMEFVYPSEWDLEPEHQGGQLIVVVGTRFSFEFAASAFSMMESSDVHQFPMLSPDGGGGGPEYIEPPKDTTCVEVAPAEVDLLELNTAALAASKQIQKQANWKDVEWGSIVYEINGHIAFTKPVTQNDPGKINWNQALVLVPDNARILALVHNHPDDQLVDDRIPSDDDWRVFENFQTLSVRGIRSDANMLTYILSDEGRGVSTRVYDKYAKNSEAVQCSLD